MSLKGKWDDIRRDIAKTNERILTITTDQTRIRANLKEVPKDSEAYQRYLKKFDDQEKEMDDLHAKLKTLQEQDNKARAAFEIYLSNITVE
jgi:septal ring factor EnvC (AmiA/AmiB activator)